MNVQPSSSPAAEFDLEGFLPYRLSILANAVSEGIARTYRERYQISVPEWRVLVILGRFPGLTASEVGERAVMDKVTVSRAVKSLLARNYLVRAADQQDRRRLPLEVSEDPGQRVLAEIIPFALDYENALKQALSRDELEQFSAVLNKLGQAARAINAGESG